MVTVTIFPLAGALLLLTGCAFVNKDPPLTPQQTARIDGITVFHAGEGPGSQRSALLVYFQGNRFPAIPEEAIRSLRVNAAAMNADAVVNVNCGTRSGVRYGPNFINACFADIVCRGQAVSF
jgi:hypothetical protein